MVKQGALFVLVGLLPACCLLGDEAADWQKMKRIVPRGYVCRPAVSAVEVDGRLGEKAWRTVPWSQAFLDIEGTLKPVPRFRTRMKMVWDREYLYIGARMEEPHVWGTLTEHDSVIFQDNDFEVFIDPDGDNHEYYEFEINPLGTGWDLFLPRPYKDGGKADNGWEIPGLKTAVHVAGTLNDPGDRDGFWSVEIAIPWKVLSEHAHKPAPPQPGDQWRFNFSRVQWKHLVVEGEYEKVPKLREDNWVWSPQGIIDMHRPERWGYVIFAGRGEGPRFFRQDPLRAVRDALMTVYHQQRSFRRQHDRWAVDLAELGLGAGDFRGSDQLPQVVLNDQGYTATLTMRVRGGRPVTMQVRQDSRLTVLKPGS
jgi:hypothetical protein